MFAEQMPVIAAESLDEIKGIVVHRAVTEYMREPRPDELSNPASSSLNSPLVGRFVSQNDTQVLRRLTGRLTHSLVGPSGGLTPFFNAASGDEHIHELTFATGEANLRFGSRTPYALVHEKGPHARPYMAPAFSDIRNSGDVVNVFSRRITESAERLGL